MFDWICARTADCLNCQNNKPKPKHRSEQFTEITKDLVTHQVIEILIASWSMMHFLGS